MPNRGVIRNRKYATQIRDFSGLRFGTITPTDIDGLIDFGNRAFVVIELKFMGSKIPDGQRLAIERLIDIIEETNRFALGLIAEHSTNGDIDVGMCIVNEYRWHGKWHKDGNITTVREAIDGFLNKHNLRREHAGK